MSKSVFSHEDRTPPPTADFVLILGGPSKKVEVLNPFYNIGGAVEKQISKAGWPLLTLKNTYSLTFSSG